MMKIIAVLLVVELYALSSALSKQHFLVNEMKSWDDAQLYCRLHYHDLSSFTNNIEEQQFLNYAAHESANAWVGLHKVSGVWKWSGDENATGLNWVWNNNLDQSNGGNCALVKHAQSDTGLYTQECSMKRSFYCMTSFVLVQQNETWEGALEYCRQHYYDLAGLSSENRMNSAVGRISQTQTENVWTGLRFLNGNWFWVSGDDLGYTAWPAMAQPSCPAVNLRCGALSNDTGEWTPRDCEEELNFVCQ